MFLKAAISLLAQKYPLAIAVQKGPDVIHALSVL
jgi:hypothetical protein